MGERPTNAKKGIERRDDYCGNAQRMSHPLSAIQQENLILMRPCCHRKHSGRSLLPGLERLVGRPGLEPGTG